MNCKDCKFWTKGTHSDYPEKIDVRRCGRVKMFWDCTEWGEDKDEVFRRVFTEEAKGNKAFVQDASDYSAELITLGDFGCVQFEAI